MNATPMKTCSICGVEKPLDAFRRDRRKKDGRGSLCRECDAARLRANREARRDDPAYREKEAARLRACRAALASRTDEEVALDRARLRKNNLKTCRSCRLELPFEAFGEDRTRPDGLRDSCRPCKVRSDARYHTRARIALITHWQEHGYAGGHLLPAFTEDDILLCVYCEDGFFEDIEHVVPLTLDGADDETNTVPSCANCNRGPAGKFDKPAHVWLAEVEQRTGNADAWLLDPAALVGARIL